MLHAQAPQRLALVFRKLLKLARTVRMATRREPDVETRSVNLNPARDYLLNFPPRYWRSRQFSPAFSLTPAVGIRRTCSFTVHALTHTFASALVICISMWPTSLRRK